MFKKAGKVGRPKRDIPYDEEVVKQYVERFFSIQREIKVLQEDKKQLSEEFCDRVDMKLVANVIRLVKAQLKLTASPETVNDLQEIIKDKINMVVE